MGQTMSASCPSLLKKECLTEIFLVTDFWGMGKDHFSDYFKIHDEIHLRYTEFIFQNLTFWKKKPILFWLKNQLVIQHVYTWQKLCPFKTSCEFYISYPSKHFKNAFYSQIPRYLKFWRKKILIGFCILCTFFQINISVSKLSLKHLPLKYDFITINIFIWVANKTLIQKK